MQFVTFLVFIYYCFQNGTMIKLPKFEVDIPVPAKPPKPGLRERDVTMANM